MPSQIVPSTTVDTLQAPKRQNAPLAFTFFNWLVKTQFMSTQSSEHLCYAYWANMMSKCACFQFTLAIILYLGGVLPGETCIKFSLFSVPQVILSFQQTPKKLPFHGF
jgi:hypothetical protein